MDGQRRVAGPVRRNPFFRADCQPKYRYLARGMAVCFLGAAIVHGVLSGGHLNYPGSPWLKLPGQAAALFGLAAIDIEMAGLQHHEPREVLQHIGVKPGGPLIGFDAKQAKSMLMELDWISSASVVRQFPNQLRIVVTEREPFVVWQNHGTLFVVDKAGKPMGGIAPTSSNLLLHVVGEGANLAASELVYQLESTPGLMQDLKAAVRVADRRWDLHMKNGSVIALPETGVVGAMMRAEAAYQDTLARQLVLARLDFRIDGQTSFLARFPQDAVAADPQATSSIQ
jgi:cell division protein FtsQ